MIERRFRNPDFIVSGPNTVAPEATAGDRAGGYASVFGEVADIAGLWNERVAPGAFARNLSAISNGDTTMFVYWNHNSDYVLASTRSGTLDVAEDDRGLSFDFDTSRLNDMQRSAIAAGDLQVSIGFFVRSDTWELQDDGSVLRTILDADVFELSPTSIPAFSTTEIGLRSRDAWLAASKENSTSKLIVDVRRKMMFRELSRRLNR